LAGLNPDFTDRQDDCPIPWISLTFNGIRSESGGVPADFKSGVAAISLISLDFLQLLAFGLAIRDNFG
jgi:hypothetical protein